MLARRLPQHLRAPLKSFSRTLSTHPTETGVPTPSPLPSKSQPAPVPTPQQAPNRVERWSTNQAQRPAGSSIPRFEQTVMELQPQPASAMEMVAEDPIRLVHGRKAVCDGGGGPLGHPKIYINLDKPGPRPCGYCGIRFEQAPHSGHGHH